MRVHGSDPLDELLRQWTEHHILPQPDIDRLKARIVRSLDEVAERAEHSRPVPLSTQFMRRPLRAYSAIGVIITVLIMMALSFIGQTDPNGNRSTALHDRFPPSYTKLPVIHLQDKAILLKEVESLFDGGKVWLLETGADVKIGLADHSPHHDARPVTVRIIVERREVGRTDWAMVWSADVITRSEEVIRFQPNFASEAQLALWTYVLPEGLISIDVELTLPESMKVNLMSSSLQESQKPQQVSSARANNYEFRLFQTAALLDEPVI